MLWIVIASMLLVAGLTVAWPLYGRAGRMSPRVLYPVTIIAVPSLALYAWIGTPFPPTAEESLDSFVTSLEQRVAASPSDLQAWKNLGQLYLQREDYRRAVEAFERAVALEHPQNADTLVDLGVALMNHDENSLGGRAGELFDNALATAPGNPRALFYVGVVAAAQGEHGVAATRWETLLQLSPPPEIEDMLRQGVAEWRRLAAPQPTESAADVVVEVAVTLAPAALADIAPDAAVFVIARDPEQPSPPVAAVRIVATELPRVVALGDGDAMLPGRVPSAFERLEIVARTSAGNDALPQSGDWFGSAVVTPGSLSVVDIVIDRRVP